MAELKSTNINGNLNVTGKITGGKVVRYDTNAQGLTDTEKANVRTNIGAGTSNFTGYTASNKLSTDYINNTAGWTSNSGTVTSVAIGTDTPALSVTGSPITGSGTIKVDVASGYTIPTTTDWTNRAKIYWATYGTTTYDEIKTAKDSGYYVAVRYTSNEVTGTNIYGNLYASEHSNWYGFTSLARTSKSGIWGTTTNCIYCAKSTDGSSSWTADQVWLGSGTVTSINNVTPNSTGVINLTASDVYALPSSTNYLASITKTNNSITIANNTGNEVSFSIKYYPHTIQLTGTSGNRTYHLRFISPSPTLLTTWDSFYAACSTNELIFISGYCTAPSDSTKFVITDWGTTFGTTVPGDSSTAYLMYNAYAQTALGTNASSGETWTWISPNLLGNQIASITDRITSQTTTITYLTGNLSVGSTNTVALGAGIDTVIIYWKYEDDDDSIWEYKVISANMPYEEDGDYLRLNDAGTLSYYLNSTTWGDGYSTEPKYLAIQNTNYIPFVKDIYYESASIPGNAVTGVWDCNGNCKFALCEKYDKRKPFDGDVTIARGPCLQGVGDTTWTISLPSISTVSYSAGNLSYTINANTPPALEIFALCAQQKASSYNLTHDISTITDTNVGDVYIKIGTPPADVSDWTYYVTGPNTNLPESIQANKIYIWKNSSSDVWIYGHRLSSGAISYSNPVEITLMGDTQLKVINKFNS